PGVQAQPLPRCPQHALPARLHRDDLKAGPCTCPPGSGDGHRVAPCTAPGSPYKTTGYVIKEVAYECGPAAVPLSVLPGQPADPAAVAGRARAALPAAGLCGAAAGSGREETASHARQPGRRALGHPRPPDAAAVVGPGPDG